MVSVSTVICPVCGHAGVLGPGPGGRPRASCTKCKSLERHRALAGIIPTLREAAKSGLVLDIAPSQHSTPQLQALADEVGQPYIGMDFNPAADGRHVNLKASLTHVPLADATVGVIICFHVLEHIPDDARAIAELARVLAPGGIAVIQVPHRTNVPTVEDPNASAEERVRRFGQADHVRYYGYDFTDRLTAAGLRVSALTMGELYDELATDLLGINRSEPLWLCTATTDLDLAPIVRSCHEYARRAVITTLEKLVARRDELEVAHFATIRG